ncbi:protein PFC0760c-like [Stegodyphus dumicola]|uniref:protein PFC0760c-like n=1 Tax=Stegodyphus dumicola TaxID=202533 RepID=UPI0015AA9D99|nr:protein PFC0760c-like [Stegodyphus dumicola]
MLWLPNYSHIHSNCPKRSGSSITESAPSCSTSDSTVNALSTQNFSKNPMHVDIQLKGTQLTALYDTGSQTTLITEKTYRKIGSPPLHPSRITFSGLGRDTVKSIGFLQDYIQIQNTILPAKIHVVKNYMIPLDAIIGIDFLQQTRFTFDKDGIHLCNNNNDQIFVNVANVTHDYTFPPNLSHIPKSEIFQQVQHIITPHNPHEVKTAMEDFQKITESENQLKNTSKENNDDAHDDSELDLDDDNLDLDDHDDKDDADTNHGAHDDDVDEDGDDANDDIDQDHDIDDDDIHNANGAADDDSTHEANEDDINDVDQDDVAVVDEDHVNEDDVDD